MGCSHNCSSCGGCAGVLELTEGEIAMLQQLAQFAFLPIARKASDHIPVYLEETDRTPEEYSLILQVLEQKRLVSLDFDKPLSNFHDSKYSAYPICGSVALTERGQNVVKMMEIEGILI